MKQRNLLFCAIQITLTITKLSLSIKRCDWNKKYRVQTTCSWKNKASKSVETCPLSEQARRAAGRGSQPPPARQSAAVHPRFSHLVLIPYLKVSISLSSRGPAPHSPVKSTRYRRYRPARIKRLLCHLLFLYIWV